MDSLSGKRARMPEGTNTILNQRTLEASNRRLAEVLKPGMHVLDVGCGSGSITRGIAERIGTDGLAVGIDNNPRLIEEARQSHGHLSWLSFEVADIHSLPFRERFDIVCASRVLQWLSEPLPALEQMKIAKGDPGFEAGIMIWAEVAASRGHQMVADGYVTEEERRRAEAEYREWAREEAEEQTLYLLAVEGMKTDDSFSIGSGIRPG